jgi:hypothetical protein
VTEDDSDLVGLGDEGGDERLMTALRRLAAALDAVPMALVAAARAAFGWHIPGAEVAELTYDSTLDEQARFGVRSTTQSRLFSFEAPGFTVEMEAISSGPRRRLRGELEPPQPGPVEIRQPGRSVTVVADGRGRFLVDDLRAGPLSLRLPGRRADCAAMITDWVLL